MAPTVQTNKYWLWQKPAASAMLFVTILNFASAPAIALAQNNPLQQGNAAAESVLGIGGGVVEVTLLQGLNAILTATLFFFAKFIGYTGMFFDYAISKNFISFATDRAIIETGWTISRDVANMFFILILLIMAIGTILRVESYQAKQLLPKLIAVALLINFSLVIGFFIIDFANLLGKSFYERINAGSDIASKVMAGTAFQKVFDIKAAQGGSSSFTNWVAGGVLGGAALCIAGAAGAAAGFLPAILACGSGGAALASGLAAGLAGWWTWGANKDFKSAAEYFYPVVVSNVLGAILLFVFVFGGILLLIRYGILVLLLVLAPIAYVSYILPDTEKRIWHAWWDKFLMHAFFFPAFLFLLYMSLTIANAYNASATVGGVANPGFLTALIVIVVFLISSLLIARQMGVYFSDSVMKWASTSRQYLTGYVGSAAWRQTGGRLGVAMQKSQSQTMRRIGNVWAGYGSKLKGGWSRAEQQKEKAGFEIAATMKKAASELHKDFAANKNKEYRRGFVEAVIKDPQKLAQFLKNADGGTKSQFMNTVRTEFGASAEKTVNEAERKMQLGSLKEEGLAERFNNQTDEERVEDLKIMDTNKIVSLLEAQKSDQEALNKTMQLVASKLDPEKQEKFYRAAMTGASIETAEKAYSQVPAQMRREFALRNTERTEAIYNQMAQSGNAEGMGTIEEDIKQSGAETRYIRAGNPNRKNWLRRLGKNAELAEVEREEQEVKDKRETEKRLTNEQTRVAKLDAERLENEKKEKEAAQKEINKPIGEKVEEARKRYEDNV